MFLSRIFFAVVIFIAALFVNSCKDAPTDIGSGIPGQQDKPNTTKFNSDSVNQYSYSFKNVIPLYSSSRLLLGKKDNVKASTMMKFYIVLPDTIASAINSGGLNILSSTIQLVRNYYYGDNNSTFEFTVHEINSNWSLNFTSDSLSTLSYASADIVQSKDIGDSLFNFNIDNSVVESWLKAAADTTTPEDNGIIIRPSDADAEVIGFYALTASLVYSPNLQVVLEKPGVYIDTLNFFPAQDLHIVEGELPSVNSEDIVVQGGLAANSKIWFDVSSIPVDAAISKSELIFKLDTLETLTGSSFNNSILAYSMLDSTNLDSTYSSALLLSRSGDSLYVSSNTLTAYVENWIRSGNNQGLLLTINGQANGLELFSIKGSNSANVSERPKLKLTYTRLK